VLAPGRTVTAAFALALLFAPAPCVLPAGAGAAGPSPACARLSNQAAAQERFVKLGGAPGRDPGGFDADDDGVACEGLVGPYEGFATIAYNVRRGFFYGTAAMPVDDSDGAFACLAGNRHFAEGPRLLRIHRITSRGDRVISRTLGAEARPASGRLVWKLDRKVVPPGRYYAAFEEEVRLSPYKPSECPGFRSAETRLPRLRP
jgi:hypothetical protein